MTTGLFALLLGLFLMPLLALLVGHRLTRRGRAARLAFWGLVIGHTLAALVATVAVLYRPVRWDAADATRGALGLWSMLLLGLVGGAIGWLVGRRSREDA